MCDNATIPIFQIGSITPGTAGILYGQGAMVRSADLTHGVKERGYSSDARIEGEGATTWASLLNRRQDFGLPFPSLVHEPEEYLPI
jgi:hypothetical protein